MEGKDSKNDENERMRKEDGVFVSRGGREGCEGYEKMWRGKDVKGVEIRCR